MQVICQFHFAHLLEMLRHAFHQQKVVPSVGVIAPQPSSTDLRPTQWEVSRCETIWVHLVPAGGVQGRLPAVPEPRCSASPFISRRNKQVSHVSIVCMADVGGPLATEEELQRLKDILAAFPTTEAEDERLLTGMIKHCSPSSSRFFNTPKSHGHTCILQPSFSLALVFAARVGPPSLAETGSCRGRSILWRDGRAAPHEHGWKGSSVKPSIF